ncbi:MAG: hypothetical protein ACK412_01070 [Chloroherpetonaceae bacterium]
MNARVLDVRRFVVAILVSPAVIFLLFFALFYVLYVNWAERNAIEIAETHLNARSGYTVRIDSVAVSISSLTLCTIRLLEEGQEIGELSSLVLYEPSLWALITQRRLVARRVDVGAIRTNRNDVRQFFEEQATFTSDTP